MTHYDKAVLYSLGWLSSSSKFHQTYSKLVFVAHGFRMLEAKGEASDRGEGSIACCRPTLLRLQRHVQ